jgi:hypothetical protein
MTSIPNQSDLIGWLFADWAILYFGQIIENNKEKKNEVAQNFGLLFSLEKDIYVHI